MQFDLPIAHLDNVVVSTAHFHVRNTIDNEVDYVKVPELLVRKQEGRAVRQPLLNTGQLPASV